MLENEKKDTLDKKGKWRTNQHCDRVQRHGWVDLEDIIKMNMIFPFQTRFNSDENVFCCQVKTDRQAKKVIKRLEYLLEVGL